MYKFDGDRPTEFYEIRHFDSSVWTARGRVNTFGASELTQADSEEAAHSAYAAECQKAQAEGYTLTRSWYDTGVLNREQLTTEIYDGAKRVFTAIREAHSGQAITSYGLMCDDSAMAIAAVANSETAIASAEHDSSEAQEEDRWIVSCWDFDDGGEYLDIAYRMILSPHREIPGHEWSVEYPDAVFDCCVDALAKLRADKFFDDGSTDDVIILFQLTDDPLLEANKRLNTDAVYRRYEEWATT